MRKFKFTNKMNKQLPHRKADSQRRRFRKGSFKGSAFRALEVESKNLPSVL